MFTVSTSGLTPKEFLGVSKTFWSLSRLYIFFRLCNTMSSRPSIHKKSLFWRPTYSTILCRCSSVLSSERRSFESKKVIWWSTEEKWLLLKVRVITTRHPRTTLPRNTELPEDHCRSYLIYHETLLRSTKFNWTQTLRCKLKYWIVWRCQTKLSCVKCVLSGRGVLRMFY